VCNEVREWVTKKRTLEGTRRAYNDLGFDCDFFVLESAFSEGEKERERERVV
jgi:hypothetical protein